jgi:hypothetical protein
VTLPVYVIKFFWKLPMYMLPNETVHELCRATTRYVVTCFCLVPAHRRKNLFKLWIVNSICVSDMWHSLMVTDGSKAGKQKPSVFQKWIIAEEVQVIDMTRANGGAASSTHARVAHAKMRAKRHHPGDGLLKVAPASQPPIHRVFRL